MADASMSGARVRIGVDLGGTKIEAAALDREGRVHARERVATPQGDYRGTIEAVALLVEGIERSVVAAGEIGSATIGIGAPGSTSPASGLHRNSNSTCLNGRPLHRDLEARLGRTIRLANDANCFALSEALLGAAQGAPVVFGVILGTGVGGGVVVDGRVLPGRNGIAGEWGHAPLPRTDRRELEARPCYCGLAGCREQFLSGPALEAEYAALAGTKLPLAEIAARAAEARDDAAVAVLDRCVEWLATSLADVVNLLDPDCIVLGGGVSNIDRLFALVPPRLEELVFSDVCTTPIVRARLGDSSGVFGAAMLWPTA
jgi:predicted NBD/HSP70 family sugar kinase